MIHLSLDEEKHVELSDASGLKVRVLSIFFQLSREELCVFVYYLILRVRVFEL